MKYQKPEYEASVIEINDIIAASGTKYEVEKNEDGSGNVILNASSLFS